MPTLALSGLTRSATEALASAHASRSAARSPSLYCKPLTRLLLSAAYTARAASSLCSLCDSGQYPGDGGSHHLGSAASSAALASLRSFASFALRSFAARSESPPLYVGSANESIAPPKLRRVAVRYLSSTQISRPPRVRSLTHRPGPEPGGGFRLEPPKPGRDGSRRAPPPAPPPGRMIPNTLPSAYTTPRVTPHPTSEEIHGGGP